MRLNMEISENQMASFNELKDRTGASTMKDLINNALTILEWLVNETAHGNDIAAVNESGTAYRVLITPLLQHVAKAERSALACKA